MGRLALVAMTALVFTQQAAGSGADCDREPLVQVTIEHPLHYFDAEDLPNQRTQFTCGLPLDYVGWSSSRSKRYLAKECRKLIIDYTSSMGACFSRPYSVSRRSFDFGESVVPSVNGRLLRFTTVLTYRTSSNNSFKPKPLRGSA